MKNFAPSPQKVAIFLQLDPAGRHMTYQQAYNYLASQTVVTRLREIKATPVIDVLQVQARLDLLCDLLEFLVVSGAIALPEK